ncbi:MAG: putative bicarbonate transporter, IctB family [Merismopedia sp. SIO2A8]|nr:putative bicarbonate transporter, IctB family [Symploca sp. SIO2B6]NET47432.1 putative bicarbonate transporter, IctB family [Merismopedia sp. SIO2A8]
MIALWQYLTLQRWPTIYWRASSYLGALTKTFQGWSTASILLSRGDLIAAILISLIFVVAPFVSTTLIGIFLLACAALWLILMVTESDRAPLTPVHLVVMAYWGVNTVATGFSPVRDAALEGWIKLTLNLMLFALMAKVLRSPTIRSWAIGVYLHVALLVSAVGLRQWFFGVDALATWVDPDSTLAGTTRVYSYLGNPNLLAGYLIPATLLSLAALFVWKRKMVKGLAATMLVINGACLGLTFSRGGWLGFVAGGFMFVLLLVQWILPHLPVFWRRWALPMVLGGTAGLLSVAVTTVGPLRERFLSIFAGHEDSSNSFRIYVWRGVIEMIQARPIIGIGPGNDAFNQVYPFYQEPGYTALSAYSILLEIWVESGIVGLGCFLWLLLVTISQGWIALQRLRQSWEQEGMWLMAAIATIVGMMVHGAVDTVWYRPQVSVLWWFMVAIVASYCAHSQEDTPVK